MCDVSLDWVRRTDPWTRCRRICPDDALFDHLSPSAAGSVIGLLTGRTFLFYFIQYFYSRRESVTPPPFNTKRLLAMSHPVGSRHWIALQLKLRPSATASKTIFSKYYCRRCLNTSRQVSHEYASNCRPLNACTIFRHIGIQDGRRTPLMTVFNLSVYCILKFWL